MRRPTAASCSRWIDWSPENASRTDNNNNDEFVLVSFRRHVNVDYPHARVDEEQGEGGHAGRGERA